MPDAQEAVGPTGRVEGLMGRRKMLPSSASTAEGEAEGEAATQAAAAAAAVTNGTAAATAFDTFDMASSSFTMDKEPVGSSRICRHYFSHNRPKRNADICREF